MQIMDLAASEFGDQRRKQGNKLLHSCCICGKLDVWGKTWEAYYSIKDMDDCAAIPKFCSVACSMQSGPECRDVTQKMIDDAYAREFRPPNIVYRDMTEKEKYQAALQKQKKPC